MQVNLHELLRESRPLQHPTRIKGVVLTDGEMRWSLQGLPWWRENAHTFGEVEFTFIFRGIDWGMLDLSSALDSSEDEILELFDISRLTEHDWAQPCGFEIYGHAPLPDPLSLYARIEDHLREADAAKTARDFLNMDDQGLLGSFREFTCSFLYLLAPVPESLREIVCDELQRQAVPYNVLGGKGRQIDGFLVRLGDGSFVCQEAIGEFAERGSST
jgi:hypothetical protein